MNAHILELVSNYIQVCQIMNMLEWNIAIGNHNPEETLQYWTCFVEIVIGND